MADTEKENFIAVAREAYRNTYKINSSLKSCLKAFNIDPWLIKCEEAHWQRIVKQGTVEHFNYC